MIADSLNSSTDKTNINPYVASKHDTGKVSKTYDCFQSSCIIRWCFGCIGFSVNSPYSGNGMATCMKLSNIVLNNSLNCWNQMESGGKGSKVLNAG